MKPPPFLIGAAVLFWGWQTGFLVPGIVMAGILESARWTKARWEFSNQDFNRIWMFCALLLLAALVFAFTSVEGPAEMLGFLHNPNSGTTRNMGNVTAHAAAAWVRWLPMIFFLFVAAQTFSAREGVPRETISLILSFRWKKVRQLLSVHPPSRNIDVSFSFFALCLFSASVHVSEDPSFFCGFAVLIAWALWPRRSVRFHLATWAAALLVAVGLAYAGQHAVAQLQQYIGNLNPHWMSAGGQRGFDSTQSHTALGQLGRVQASGTIVIRVDAKSMRPPSLLMAATYRWFKSATWSSGLNERDFQPVRPLTNNSSSYDLVVKPSTDVAQIACYLHNGQGLLPLPEGAGRLDNLFAFELQKSPLGAALASGPGLVIFDAHYGPGATLEGPPEPPDSFPTGSANETAALEKVIEQLGLRGQTNINVAMKAINAFFQSEFSYSVWQNEMLRHGETPLANFLLKTHKGHCEFFATATVLLLRQLGFPARYAVGYSVHEASGASKYVVRQRDAHAWCRVWYRDGWHDFDTTPASWMKIEEQRASPMQAISDAWSWLEFQFSKFRWGQTHLREYFLWGLAPVLLLLLYQILFASRRQRKGRGGKQPGEAVVWPGLDSELYQLEKLLAKRGIKRSPGEPLSTWLLRASSEQPATRQALHELLRLHYRYRFDPQGLSRPEREALRRDARACLELLQPKLR